LLGIVNVRGELLLCVCLDAVLEVNRAEGTDPDSRTASVFRRMIVIGNPGERWVFPVDEVDRVYRVNEAEMEALPVTVAKDTSACSRAIVKAGGRRIAVLEEEQLLGAFRRGCLGG
jgi:chemotaxis-related protein WspD